MSLIKLIISFCGRFHNKIFNDIFDKNDPQIKKSFAKIKSICVRIWHEYSMNIL